MTQAAGFAHLVPGFEFLQGLVKNAGSPLPGIGQWVAPTLDPDELGKRIEELRTVKFWLEQNARLLETTIQALEVQRMTLSTLKSMNVPMADLRDSLRAKAPAPNYFGTPAAGAGTASAAAKGTAPARPKAKTTKARSAAEKPAAAGAAGPSAAPQAAAGVDPAQWWGALTQQFAELTAQAMKSAPALDLGGLAAARGDAAPASATPSARPTASAAPRPKAGASRRKGQA
jgi:hypothetical protein